VGVTFAFLFLTYTLHCTAAYISPFYLREHSKRILRCALSNDSKFLADTNVMDYSLVVGVDSLKNELVVGIVGSRFNESSGVLSQKKFDRLYSDLHLGQEAGDLGKRVCVHGWRWKGRADDRHSKAI
jgi:hypothetical protein